MENSFCPAAGGWGQLKGCASPVSAPGAQGSVKIAGSVKDQSPVWEVPVPAIVEAVQHGLFPAAPEAGLSSKTVPSPWVPPPLVVPYRSSFLSKVRLLRRPPASLPKPNACNIWYFGPADALGRIIKATATVVSRSIAPNIALAVIFNRYHPHLGRPASHLGLRLKNNSGSSFGRKADPRESPGIGVEL